jgi:hypothetical protein
MPGASLQTMHRAPGHRLAAELAQHAGPASSIFPTSARTARLALRQCRRVGFSAPAIRCFIRR